jgi:MauM/NapG family ferredoxin protein
MAKYKWYIYFRRLSQVFFLLLFVVLAIKTTINTNVFSLEPEISSNVKYFIGFDPLIALVVLLTGHAISSIFFLSVLVVILTMLVGRVFCGFICPFGTIHHFFSYLGFLFYKKRLRNYKFNNWQNLKYFILLAILLLAVFKINVVGLLDPLSFFLRSLVSFIIPFLQYVLYFVAKIGAIFNLDYFASYLQGELVFNIFGKENIFFDQTFLIGFILLFLLFVDLFAFRFYCRFLCPLGAFLGILSLKSFLSVKQQKGCIKCSRCDAVCFAGANPSDTNTFKKSECMLLGNCLTECPVNVLSFGSVESKKHSVDINRREIITTAFSTIFLAPLLRYSYNEERVNSALIRPPGALNELDFLQKCIRCSACVKVCPQNFLQPSLLEGRLEALWTPIGKGKFGYCEYNCNLCGIVCPTGAIKKLNLQEKKKVSIGTAFINKNKCLPHAFGIECVVCEEICPVSPKAIYFEETEFVKPNGNIEKIKQPVVIPDKCIGCAVCENKCPVLDKPAIYVSSIGEDRSEKNQFLLKY